jgi:hypothetical protein
MKYLTLVPKVCNLVYVKDESKIILMRRMFIGTAQFCIFIDYRGHHRKGVAIHNAT